MVKVEPYDPWHYSALMSTHTVANQSLEQLMGIEHAMSLDDPNSYSLVDGDDVYAIGGVSLVLPGIGEGWVLVAKDIPCGYLFHRAAVRIMRMTCDALELRRLQAAVPADQHRAIRWAQSLGMTNEGTMKKYGPDGSDFVRFAWVR